MLLVLVNEETHLLDRVTGVDGKASITPGSQERGVVIILPLDGALLATRADSALHGVRHLSKINEFEYMTKMRKIKLTKTVPKAVEKREARMTTVVNIFVLFFVEKSVGRTNVGC